MQVLTKLNQVVTSISKCSTLLECSFNSLLHPKKSETRFALFAAQCRRELWSHLHKHAEIELLYVLEGSLEFFMAKEGTQWATAGMGDVIAIPSNVKHALRNRSSLPVTLALVTKSRLYAFFRELAKPFDPNQRPAPLTPEEMQELFEVAAKYGYWMASPDENAAIGLSIS